jgi:hypothetical protein
LTFDLSLDCPFPTFQALSFALYKKNNDSLVDNLLCKARSAARRPGTRDENRRPLCIVHCVDDGEAGNIILLVRRHNILSRENKP